MGGAVPGRRGAALLVLPAALLVALAGCGATGTDPSPSATPRPTLSPSASPSATGAPIPADGVGLVGFGIENGPAQFSVPRGAVASSVVDQADNVVVVLSAPPPREVVGYLERTLPPAGFVITDTDSTDTTFTFDGNGWQGSFTTGDGVSAILLRPR